LNDLFVNVKVDREERPDVDAIYMQSVQALTGRGGWPMSVWLTPGGEPFYAGTYFPDEDRHGMPSFRRVCEAVSEARRERRDEVVEQGRRLTDAIASDVIDAAATAEVDASMLDDAYRGVLAQFEPQYGGFGRAPKFPPAMLLTFLARADARAHAVETRTMLTTTLDAMAAGGLYDQLGGGFARYSTDDFWLVPHFEKMLYDNALLTRAYTQGFLVTGDARYQRVVEETIGYVLRDLRDTHGGFFSAEDADSEGVEGKFYCWSLAEIRDVCGADADAAIEFYGVTEGGNFVDPHTGFRGNILHVVRRGAEPSEAVERGRVALLERRSHRVRPGLDDKVLLGWNALMLRALTEAAAVFGRDDWMGAARTNAEFLLRALRREDGRFLRSSRAPYLAYAEDYAALLEALVTLAELDSPRWLAPAREVADELLRLFADPDGPGFFTTGVDAEQLVVRPKDLFDNATPAASSLAANGLLRLAAITGERSYEQPAVAIVRALGGPMASHPTAFPYLLEPFERLVRAPLEIAIVGDPADPRTAALRREVTRRLVPGSVLLVGAPGSVASPLFDGRTQRDGAPTAYVCEHYACREPVTEPDALGAQLNAVVAGQRAAT
jgi:uncharacterized protein